MGDDYRVYLFRPLCVLIALCACAWFAIGIRDTQNTDQATAILSASPHLTPAAARRVDSLLNDAGLLNPDRQIQILRGQLALQAGHRALAQRILEGVVAAEPQNLVAWSWLRQAAPPGSRTAEAAYFHQLLLDPPVR
jgi:hypothetical protein